MTGSRHQAMRRGSETLTDTDMELFVSEGGEEWFYGTAVMSLIKKIHWYSAAAVDTTGSESEDERKNRGWNKNKIQFKGGGKKKNTVRIWGNLLYLMFVFLSSKIAGLINSGTCPQSIEFNRIIIICSCFYWDGSVPSVCVILDSVQHKHITDHRSIESISADQTPLNPRFLLILPFACTRQAASRTSVTSVDPQLHSAILFGKFLHFLSVISRSLCALCTWWHRHVHHSDLMIHAQC